MAMIDVSGAGDRNRWRVATLVALGSVAILSACRPHSTPDATTTQTEATALAGAPRSGAPIDSLCGLLRTAPLITADSVGPIVVGSSLAEVRSRCPEVRVEMEDQDTYSLVAFGSIVTLHFDRDGSMTAVTVRAGELRTQDGLGPGSTVADLSVLGRVKEVYLCEGVPAAVIYRARPMYTFWFRECNATRATDVLALADTTRVLLVEISGSDGI